MAYEGVTVRSQSCEDASGNCNGRCFSRDELADATSRAGRKAVVHLYDRDCLRRDECVEVTFAVEWDRSSDCRGDHGYMLDGDAVGVRILDGDAQPVARELSQRDRADAEWDAEMLVDRSDLLERWTQDERDDHSLACGGV